MKLSNKEKVILAVFLAIVIMVAGAFLLVVPEYQKIDGNRSSLDASKAQRDQLYNTLTRESTIDKELEDAAKDAEEFANYFYDDMTTYEADAMFREIIANAVNKDNGNLELKTDSLSIGEFTTSTLELSAFIPAYVTYPLKDYSGYQEPSGIDWSAYNLNYDADGNIIEDEAYAAVAEQLAKDLLKELMRLGLLAQNQTIGSITADFELTCTRQQYLDFLDYVHGLERATYISGARINYTKTNTGETAETNMQPTYDEEGNVILPQEREPNFEELRVRDDDEATYSVNMTLFCVTELQTEEEDSGAAAEAATEPAAENPEQAA